MKTLLFFSLLSTLLFAAPAFDGLREFKNADGTAFMAKGQGNQHLNWIETEDGAILRYNEATRNFEYAEIKEDALEPSGIKYENTPLKRAAAFERVDKIDKADLSKLWQERQKSAHERAHPKLLH